MPTLTAFVLAAFVGYAASWYLGVIEGNFALLMFSATVVTGIYWLAERYRFKPQREAAAAALESIGITDQPLASIAKREEWIYVYGSEDDAQADYDVVKDLYAAGAIGNFDAAVIRERLETASYIHKGVRITFDNQVEGSKVVFDHQDGLADFLKKVLAERSAKPVHDAPFVLGRESGPRIDLILQWTESTDEHLRSFVNGIPTGSGGTHENGLRAGLGKAVRNYIDTHNLSPKGVTLTAEDIREGLTGILSVFIEEPQFQGQTKDRLNNPELTSAVDSAVPSRPNRCRK